MKIRKPGQFSFLPSSRKLAESPERSNKHAKSTISVSKNLIFFVKWLTFMKILRRFAWNSKWVNWQDWFSKILLQCSLLTVEFLPWVSHIFLFLYQILHCILSAELSWLSFAYRKRIFEVILWTFIEVKPSNVIQIH